MSIYDRHLYLTRDNLGNDPLTDKLVDKIMVIPYSSIYEIPFYNENRPDKISALFFGSPELYWVILVYNKLIANTELTAGSFIKIPNFTILNDLLVKQSQGKRLSKQIYLK
jgi:hypothetical protein